MATEENVVAPAEDSFGTFEDAAEEAVESKEPINDSHVKDSFGTFNGAGSEGNITTEIEENTTPQAEIPALTSGLPSPSHSDPFGSLPEVENLPLPPLTSPFFEEKKSLDAPTTEEEDDFGDFDGQGPPDTFQSTHSELENPEQLVVSNDDDFGGFEGTAVATENAAEIESNDDAAEDGFGAFGDSSTASPFNDASPDIANSEQSFPTVLEEKKSHEDANIGRIAVDQVDGEESKPSFGMSAFDAFGDIEDAPLPPLDGFAPSTNNEIEATETLQVNGNNNDETFGAFGTVADPNIDADPVDDNFGTFEGAAVTAETSNVDAPVEDSFGTFEGVAEEIAEPEAVVDDSFGTFEGAAHGTDQAEAVDDSFTPFEGAAEETTEAKHSEEEVFVEDSFGTFEGVGEEKETAEVEQNTAPQTEVPATSFGLPSPSLSDPFGSLPEIENLPLPPLTSPTVVERKLEDVALQVEENTPDSENDGVGGFGSVPVDEGACVVLNHESKQIDGDDFGEFESTTPQVQVNDDANNTIDAISETHAPLDNDDDFGYFGEAPEVPAPPLHAALTNVDAVTATNEEDDFGDFGEAPEVPAPLLHAAVTDVDAVSATNEEDDFGDFGEAQVPAPLVESASTGLDAATDANNAVDTDFGFRDWGSGDWQGQGQQGPDILSGGFDAFSTPAPELTAEAVTDEHATPTTPNGENDDEFGSFEAPKSDVTQDEGPDGFVFVDNTEPNSQVDSFGEFSSPANESFSPFDTGADEENIMQPKLEEDHTDGFGDFSSFDNGAQQPEEVKEGGSQKSSLSRQELIGSEYTNLMERWANIVSTVKSDVERGQKIIDYVSTTLPSSDRAIIFKSSKFQNHILGLAEFVRVVRCIAATIADVFCLSDNIDLQASHLPEWNDNPIIADAITIETLWSELSSRVVELDILPQPPQLETVIEIRASASTATVQQKTDLCHLTLQPFSDKLCTQSSVDWNGNKYMACAANLLLHRMS
eukprot:scaffold1567_cov129-Skeletonema_menzelii.AAC.10